MLNNLHNGQSGRSLISEFFFRLQQDTPIFFRKIRAAGASLVGIGGALISPELLQLKAHLPEVIFIVGNNLVAIGTVMALVASAACKHHPDQP